MGSRGWKRSIRRERAWIRRRLHEHTGEVMAQLYAIHGPALEAAYMIELDRIMARECPGLGGLMPVTGVAGSIGGRSRTLSFMLGTDQVPQAAIDTAQRWAGRDDDWRPDPVVIIGDDPAAEIAAEAAAARASFDAFNRAFWDANSGPAR